MNSLEALDIIIDHFKKGDGFPQIFKEETDIIFKDLKKLEKYEMVKKTIKKKSKYVVLFNGKELTTEEFVSVKQFLGGTNR